MSKQDPYFTLKQLKCIEYLAVGEKSQVDIAAEIAVNPASVTRWKKDPKFMHAVVMRSRSLLREDLPAVYSSLSTQSKDGSAQHIKILLDHLEGLEKANANTATISFTWKSDDDE